MTEKLREVEEQHINLSTSYNFLNHHITLEEDMKSFNIQELITVQKANQEVNEGIHIFMQKWESLKKLSGQIH